MEFKQRTLYLDFVLRSFPFEWGIWAQRNRLLWISRFPMECGVNCCLDLMFFSQNIYVLTVCKSRFMVRRIFYFWIYLENSEHTRTVNIVVVVFIFVWRRNYCSISMMFLNQKPFDTRHFCQSNMLLRDDLLTTTVDLDVLRLPNICQTSERIEIQNYLHIYACSNLLLCQCIMCVRDIFFIAFPMIRKHLAYIVRSSMRITKQWCHHTKCFICRLK